MLIYDNNMNDYDSEEINGKVSKINAAGLINLTLEELWKGSFTKQKANNLYAWNRELDCIWLILGGDVDDGDAIEKEYNKIEELIGQTGSLVHKQEGFTSQKTDSQKIALQYALLMKKARFLRRLQNKQGKGTAYQDNSEDYMDG